MTLGYLEISLLAFVHLCFATWTVYHALLYKRDTRAALGWIMACIFIPYGGPLFYFFFGINRVRGRASGKGHGFFRVGYESPRSGVPRVQNAGAGLDAIGHRVTGRTLVPGNKVTLLHNGDGTYPEMLHAIASATERVWLATYILKTDDTGTAFADALAAAANRGVETRVLVDGIGEMYSWRRPSKLLRKKGINVRRFMPPKLFPPSIHINLRNHRKLLIVDRDVGFTGGMNIADENRAQANKRRKITDIHFSLAGRVVEDLAHAFDNDWQFAGGTKGSAGWPSGDSPAGDAACRVVPDGPSDEMDALAQTIQGVVSAAQRSVDIMTPYFLPSLELVATLQSAALRGVRVRIVLPQKNNLFYVHWANRNVLAELLEWGIEVCYQPPPFCHSKLLCIDERYSLIGSANLDPRSLRLNFELGVEVFCTQLNAALRTHVDEVVAVSRPLTAQALAARSIPARLRDSASALLSPYL